MLCLLPLTGCQFKNGMEQHLRDAIDLYSERQYLYSAQTSGLSDSLFKKLIGTEKLALVIAKYFDIRAYSYQQKGIAIISADFVSMDDNAGYGAPIKATLPLNENIVNEVEALLAEFEPISDEFSPLAQQCHDVIVAINVLEEGHAIYLPMTKHLLESIGYAALHAPDYNEKSNGETLALSRDFINVQIASLSISKPMAYDVAANAFHQQGVGILVNDLPHIPFLEDFENR